MEKDNYEKGFLLNTGKISILLTLKRARDLKPHEETVPTDLATISQALERDPILRHPIIADSTTGAVLDGTHRLAALSKLGCRTIPTALIDYQNPLVRIDRWFRTITGANLNNFRRHIEDRSPEAISTVEAARRLLSRKCYATLRDKGECLAFMSDDSGPLGLCRSAFGLEEIARNHGLKIIYTDNDDMASLRDSSFLMSTIRLDKSEVVASCLRHVLFPPKSTRHLIPSRPLGIGVPLPWLRRTDVAEAEAEFEKHLRSKTVRRLPEGSWVGSRRYMEEVFLFE